MTVRSSGMPIPAWLLVLILGATSVLHSATESGNNDSVELQIKAAYLLNFARYVYWPLSAGADTSTPLIIGILGHDPLSGTLEKTVSGRTVGGRPIQVKLFPSIEQIEKCDILFVPRSASKATQAALDATSGKPTLTVSDQQGFSGERGMIEFILADDTVRFAINNKAVEKAGLKLNSELLRVAYSINGRRK